MKRRLMVLMVVLLLCVSAWAFHALLPTSGEHAVSNMAELGLMLLDEDTGVSVLAVRDRSPAERAGIMPGDVLTTANGTPFQTIDQLETLLHTVIERSMLLQLRRGQQDELILVQLILH